MSLKHDGRSLSVNLNKRYGVYLVMATLILMAGLSMGIGGDVTNTYWPEFSRSPELDKITPYSLSHPETLPATSFKYKPLYIITRAIFRSFTSEFWIYHIFHALYINIVIFLFLKKRTKYLCLALLYYFIINYFEYNTEIIRESLAVATGLLAFMQIEKKRYILYLLLAFASYMFHSSGLIVFLMPIGMVLSKVSQKYILIVFIILAILAPVIYEMLNMEYLVEFLDSTEQQQSSRINQTIDSNFNANFFIMQYLRFLVVPGLLMYFAQKRLKLKYIGFVYMYILFRLLGMYGVMFYRFANYYAPFFWIFMATASYGVAASFPKKYTGMLILVIFLIYFYLQDFYLLGADNSGLGDYIYQRYIPYKSILSI